MRLLRLYPPPGREVSAIYEDLVLPPRWHVGAQGPYVVVNMVGSVDGRTTVDGKAAGLGSKVDRRAMRTLRSKADAVMIGAGTLRAERLSLGLDGSDGEPPLAIVVTNTGDMPLREHLIPNEEQEVSILVSEALDEGSVERLSGLAQVMRAPADRTGAVDLGGALRALRREHGVECVLVEGGPGLNHALISRDLVDELFVTVVPELVGGTVGQNLTLLRGPGIPARRRPALELLAVHLAGDELFLRYALRRPPQSSA